MPMLERAGQRLSPAFSGTGTHWPPPQTSSLTLLKLQSPLYDPSTSLELQMPQRPMLETSVTSEPASETSQHSHEHSPATGAQGNLMPEAGEGE